jgi:hypothetical protein
MRQPANERKQSPHLYQAQNIGSRSHMNKAAWHARYTAAIVEHDLSRLSTRINEAEAAIFARIQELGEDSDSNGEREAIARALSSLRALQRNLLRCPRDFRQIA